MTWIPAGFTVIGLLWLGAVGLMALADSDPYLEYLFGALIGFGFLFTAAIAYAIGHAAEAGRSARAE